MHKFFLCFISALIFTGCATAKNAEIPLSRKAMQIEPGLTKDEVRAILGQPQNKQFHGKEEAWQYCRASYETFFKKDYNLTYLNSNSYVMIWFHKNKVTGMTTYNKVIESRVEENCESYFKTINWEEVP